jgi:chromate transporter
MRGTVAEIARLFLRLGTTAFGGPAAHIAMMQDEVVRRRRWLSDEEFLDLVGATNLIPGPNSTELAIHIGRRRAGWPGLLIAGLCFIIPAALMVSVLAWAYVKYGSRPQLEGILYGIKPAIIAVIVQALFSLAKSALKTRGLWLLGIAAAGAAVLGVHELLVLFCAGLLWMILRQAMPYAGMACAVVPVALWPLFLFFFKTGSVLFGSGYVLVAFLRADLVERWGWLTEAQLLDAIAIGQLTPGPVFTTATFIGYLLGGGAGAVVATVGIFLPAFVFVAASAPLLPRLRKSATAAAFLDGINVASLALMAVVSWELGRSALVDGLTIGIAVASAIALLQFGVNSAWLVLGGALLGLVASSL